LWEHQQVTSASPPPQRTASLVLLASLAGAALYACYRLLTPFLSALAWALAFAVVGSPLHRYLAARIRYPNLAAGLAVAVVAAILVLPAWIASQQIVGQAVVAVNFWTQHDPLSRLPRLPFLNDLDLTGALTDLARQLPALLKGSVEAATQLPIATFCLFFFFRDRELMLNYARSWLPLSEEETSALTSRISDILHATIFGRIMLACIQGGLGGLMFLWLGLPTPLLWGLVMSFLAIIPFLGASLVWGPAVIYLFLAGHPVKALIMAAWGVLVVSTIDNALYPFLVGARMQLHPLATFIGVLGGIAWFGPAGLILGPVILATTSALLDVCRNRVQELVPENPEESEPVQPAPEAAAETVPEEDPPAGLKS
jgi:predicted PurR-regulated permease PerM